MCPMINVVMTKDENKSSSSPVNASTPGPTETPQAARPKLADYLNKGHVSSVNTSLFQMQKFDTPKLPIFFR